MRRAVLVLVLVLVRAGAAEAGDERVDATYGRLDGDLAFAGAAGVIVGPRAPRGGADLRLRYLSTAGLFATYEDSLGAASEPVRALAFGVEFRPLFLARWATGRELGSPRLDLLIDSLGLELGAVFAQPEGGRFGARPGLQAGVGLELPFLAQASGPFLGLHAGVRWSDHALSGGPPRGPSDHAAFVTIAIGWQQIFSAHVVDVGDVRDR